MDYMVIGPDGQEYGPANVDTLKQWVSENRLAPTTMLKDFASGRTMAASTVPELFPPAAPPMATAPMTAGPSTGPGPAGAQNWSQPPSNYYQRGPGQPNAKPYYGQDTGTSDVLWAIARSALAIVFFFVFHGIGLIFAIYAVIYAFRGVSKGHKFAWVAVAISIVALVAVAIGWMLRIGTGPSNGSAY